MYTENQAQNASVMMRIYARNIRENKSDVYLDMSIAINKFFTYFYEFDRVARIKINANKSEMYHSTCN